jgi:hypothetical protein
MAKKKIAGNQSPKVGSPKKARTKKTTHAPEIQEAATPIAEPAVAKAEASLPESLTDEATPIAETAVVPTEGPPLESPSETAAQPSTPPPSDVSQVEDQAQENPAAAPAAKPEVTPVDAQVGQGTPDATPVAKSKRMKAAKEPKATKVSAIDAAAKVLAESGEAMTTKTMIEQMASKGYWSSPGGQTPAATLYSANLREISTKGEAARFPKTERGKFALKTQG